MIKENKNVRFDEVRKNIKELDIDIQKNIKIYIECNFDITAELMFKLIKEKIFKMFELCVEYNLLELEGMNIEHDPKIIAKIIEKNKKEMEKTLRIIRRIKEKGSNERK